MLIKLFSSKLLNLLTQRIRSINYGSVDAPNDSSQNMDMLVTKRSLNTLKVCAVLLQFVVKSREVDVRYVVLLLLDSYSLRLSGGNHLTTTSVAQFEASVSDVMAVLCQLMSRTSESLLTAQGAALKSFPSALPHFTRVLDAETHK